NEAAQLGLVIFLSVLLDFFAAFFVGLIGEELRFRQQFNQRHAIYVSDTTVRQSAAGSNPPRPEHNQERDNAGTASMAT
ncbi:hypothetical protein R0J87_24515, partial [Halomonas sp. SIMBA_159]